MIVLLILGPFILSYLTKDVEWVLTPIFETKILDQL